MFLTVSETSHCWAGNTSRGLWSSWIELLHRLTNQQHKTLHLHGRLWARQSWSRSPETSPFTVLNAPWHPSQSIIVVLLSLQYPIRGDYTLRALQWPCRSTTMCFLLIHGSQRSWHWYQFMFKWPRPFSCMPYVAMHIMWLLPGHIPAKSAFFLTELFIIIQWLHAMYN